MSSIGAKQETTPKDLKANSLTTTVPAAGHSSEDEHAYSHEERTRTFSQFSEIDYEIDKHIQHLDKIKEQIDTSLNDCHILQQEMALIKQKNKWAKHLVKSLTRVSMQGLTRSKYELKYLQI